MTMNVNIVFPVLNEEKRMPIGIRRTLQFLDSNHLENCRITIVDNGSTDRTLELIKELQKEDARIDYISLKERGFGVAFKTAVIENKSDIIGYMDIDLSTNIRHMLTVLKIFDSRSDVDIVKGNRLSPSSKVIGRKLTREITSRGLDLLIHFAFKAKVHDTMCGFQFFRKEAIENLVNISSNDKGWFYCAELLLRAERLCMKIEEIPVVWKDDYDTKVNVCKTVSNYLERIISLRREI